jgi:hypothetical protein
MGSRRSLGLAGLRMQVGVVVGAVAVVLAVGAVTGWGVASAAVRGLAGAGRGVQPSGWGVVRW